MQADDRVVTFTEERFYGYGSALGFDAVWVGGVNAQVARIPLGILTD